MTRPVKRPLALIILDGWGSSLHKDGKADEPAHTPHYDAICARYPHTRLAAGGERVGLREDSVGNAEAGHTNIGAGRVVKSESLRIERAIESGKFFENEILKTGFGKAAAGGKPVHLIGLLSDSEVHSSLETLYALLRMAKQEGASDVFVHGILDGRDVAQRTADIYVEAVEIKMAEIGVGKIATLCGRFYAMDSGENWERTARAYTMLVHSEGDRSPDAMSAVRFAFLRGLSDDFIAPIVIEKERDVPLAAINDGDIVIFFNHRADGMRQLVRSLAVPDDSAKPRPEAICLTEYDRGFDLPSAFKRKTETNLLAEIFDEHNISNYRITETDRVPHLTEFFNGGSDTDFSTENYVFVAARGGNPGDEPESRSFKITDMLLRGIEADENGVFIVNLPAIDLAAGTGASTAMIEAMQYVDTCLGGILEKIREYDGVALITSSHGRRGEISDSKPDSVPNSLVPFHFIDDSAEGIVLRDGGALEDIAPTILGILGIEKPSEMTGSDLRNL